jgi:hypothetical protein
MAVYNSQKIMFVPKTIKKQTYQRLKFKFFKYIKHFWYCIVYKDSKLSYPKGKIKVQMVPAKHHKMKINWRYNGESLDKRHISDRILNDVNYNIAIEESNGTNK